MAAVGRGAVVTVAAVVGAAVVEAGDEVVGTGELFVVGVEADGVVVLVAAVPVSLPQAVALTSSAASRPTQRRREAGGRLSVWLLSSATTLVVFMSATIDLRGGGAHRPHPLRSAGTGRWHR